ncbi:MAG TPA: DegT/DnrJ/EryC1/StrS family aminotransferase, partial [Clostridiales bacterium]|nr:DegT/DnrJ/EryC1/StrS family aminotransferase [Clostridiales bacterium]
MRKDFLEFSPPVIGDDEVNAVVETLRSSWITTGPKTKEFEKKFAEKFGAPAALAVNSCTAALHTALVGLGIGPGDEVITTPMTFCSTVNVIEQVGARPVLVDVEPDTLNIDPDKIEDAVTPKTKAIMPVHYSGHPVDLDAIYDIAERHNLFVVEDAAHAVSAKYKGRYIGTGGTIAAFSFYATKNMTTAEGGMLTGTPDFVEKCRIISLHGMSRDAWNRYSKEGSWYYEVLLPGFKYNMTDIQASLGLVQLEKLESFQLRRAEIVAKYNQEFKNYDALEVPVAKAEVEHAWHLYVLKLNLEALRINRNQFIEELKVRNIGTSV